MTGEKPPPSLETGAMETPSAGQSKGPSGRTPGAWNFDTFHTPKKGPRGRLKNEIVGPYQTGRRSSRVGER
jgi:hypothetical protein